MLADVKQALRISHAALDNEIEDLIEAARHDLMLSGVSASSVNDETDPLIKRSIVIYVKANFLSDDAKAQRFQQSYNLLKQSLTLAGDYIGE